jgi:hypothetical protein
LIKGVNCLAVPPARYGEFTLRCIIEKPEKFISMGKRSPRLDKGELTIET